MKPGVRLTTDAGFFLAGRLTFLHPARVDPESIVREIKRQAPAAPRYRSAKGAWVKPAWTVRRMVEKEGWMVSDAVREVVARLGLHPKDTAFGGVRAAFYVVRKAPWKDEPK